MDLKRFLRDAVRTPLDAGASRLVRAHAIDTKKGIRIPHAILILASHTREGYALLLVVGVHDADAPNTWIEHLEDPFVAYECGVHGASTPLEAAHQLGRALNEDNDNPVYAMIRDAVFVWVHTES